MAQRLDQHTELYDELIRAYRGEAAPRREGRSEVLLLWIVGQRKLLRMPEAMLFSGEWQIVAKGRVMLDLYVDQPNPPKSAYLSGVGSQNAQVFFEESLGEVQDAFVLGGSTNYAHWMLDCLPRLAMLEDADAGLGRACKIVVNAGRTKFQEETLALLGIGRERLLELAYPGVWSMRDCFVPCTGSGSGTGQLVLQADAVAWVRERLMERVGLVGVVGVEVVPSKRGKRIFVSRLLEGPDKMRLKNHKAVIEAVSRLGFEVVSLAGMSVVEQVRLFSQAAIVTGAHGAGFTNMLFAPPGATLVELMGPRVAADYGPNQFYARLCAVLGQRYARVVGEQVEPEKMDDRHVSTERYTVSPEAVLRQLSKALQ